MAQWPIHAWARPNLPHSDRGLSLKGTSVGISKKLKNACRVFPAFGDYLSGRQQSEFGARCPRAFA